MSRFSDIWDSSIPLSMRLDILGGLAEDAVNSYLSAHRKFDSEKYTLKQTYTGEGKSSFTLVVTVNAPLTVELPPVASAPQKTKYTEIIRFPSYPGTDGRGSALQAGEDVLNIYANDNTFSFSWTTKDGKTFSYELDKVKFLLGAQVDSVTDSGKFSIKFVVRTLSVDQVKLTNFRNQIGQAEPGPDEKLDALFMTLLQVISAQISRNLAETVEIPAMQIGSIDIYPTVLAMQSKAIVIGATGDIRKAIRHAADQMQGNISRIKAAFDSDIAQAGSLEHLVFPSRVVTKAQSLDAASAAILFSRSQVKGQDEIWAGLANTRAILDGLEHARAPKPTRGLKAKNLRTTSAANLGVGLSVRLLQIMASQLINVNQENCTNELSLGLIKGSACAKVHVWNPVITVSQAGLKGQVNIDVWAGLEYYIKRVWDCSWSWDGPHDIGLGLVGTPSVSLSTIQNSNGLSISANFNLSGVHLETGINPVIDQIIAALDGPFIAILQAILNAIASLISFVVIPVQMDVPGQGTSLKLDSFATAEYTRGPPPGLNFLAVDCVASGVKK